MIGLGSAHDPTFPVYFDTPTDTELELAAALYERNGADTDFMSEWSKRGATYTSTEYLQDYRDRAADMITQPLIDKWQAEQGWDDDAQHARWYGEVIIARSGETDYAYAYSKARDEPDPRSIVPGLPDRAVLEMTVKPTPRNEEYAGPDEYDDAPACENGSPTCADDDPCVICYDDEDGLHGNDPDAPGYLRGTAMGR